MKTDPLADYLGAQPIVIVDTSSTSRLGLVSSLVKMGAKRSLMTLAGDFEEAKAEILRIRPKLVFSDFQLGKKSGLDLIPFQKGRPDDPAGREMMFILVTGSATQSTVARAAEEDVDTFIFKPYAFETLKKCVTQTLQAKLHPSSYLMKIAEGKEQLLQGKPDLAIPHFTEAMKLDATPTLACFYLGQAEAMKELLDDALQKYTRGLSMNKIHYKCLTGLFDLLQAQKRSSEAYDVVKRLAQYFPSNPNRLSSVLRLAIVTSNFDDIEGYYRIFTLLDERPEELLRYVCSAMAITGKHYLRDGVRTRAMEVFDKVAVSSAGRTGYLKYVVETLLEFECGKDSGKYLKYFPPASQSQEDFRVTKFLCDYGAGLAQNDLIQQGRSLLASGTRAWPVHRAMIILYEQAKLSDAAANLRDEAKKHWPDKAATL